MQQMPMPLSGTEEDVFSLHFKLTFSSKTLHC